MRPDTAGYALRFRNWLERQTLVVETVLHFDDFLNIHFTYRRTGGYTYHLEYFHPTGRLVGTFRGRSWAWLIPFENRLSEKVHFDAAIESLISHAIDILEPWWDERIGQTPPWESIEPVRKVNWHKEGF